MDTSAQLVELIFSELPGDAAATDRFRETYEQLFTFELDRSTLSEDELTALKRLFDIVVWYSPFEDERNDIPHYKSEGDVVAAILRARESLGALGKTSIGDRSKDSDDS
jgi:hypothetical protein